MDHNRKLKFYSNPAGAGWLAWIEDGDGQAFAFVGLDLRVVLMSELQ